MTQILYDRNQIPYTEERISNFIEADPDEIEVGNEPDITLSIRKYPKRYFISFEVDEFLSPPYDPIDGEDASRCYIPPKAYLWPERYFHNEFEQRREEILNLIKVKLQQKYLFTAAEDNPDAWDNPRYK